jgi:hypothetical protein
MGMGMSARGKGGDRKVTRAWAAKVLGIGPDDLPDGPWTKRHVRELRQARPEWLTQARRAWPAARQQAKSARTEELAAQLRALGYDAPDLGSVDQAFGYIEGACLGLQHAVGCSEQEADDAARALWPRSMSAYDAYDEEDDLA